MVSFAPGSSFPAISCLEISSFVTSSFISTFWISAVSSIVNFTLREETAPEGYLIAKDVEFEVKDTGEVQHVTMVDEEKPAEKTPESGKPVSDAPKTGDNSNLWLWFMLLGMSAAGDGTFAFMRKKRK